MALRALLIRLHDRLAGSHDMLQHILSNLFFLLKGSLFLGNLRDLDLRDLLLCISLSPHQKINRCAASQKRQSRCNPCDKQDWLLLRFSLGLSFLFSCGLLLSSYRAPLLFLFGIPESIFFLLHELSSSPYCCDFFLFCSSSFRRFICSFTLTSYPFPEGA